jgi:hypothetical protein
MGNKKSNVCKNPFDIFLLRQKQIDQTTKEFQHIHGKHTYETEIPTVSFHRNL